MKTPHRLIAAALLSFAASAAAQDLYIRGGFNGWGLEHPLTAQGKGIFETQALIGPGFHAFKLGSKDWATEWVIDPVASVTVTPDADYKVQTRAGAEDFLFVKSAAPYRFRLDLTDPKAPLLRVTRLAAPAAAGAQADPHQGHASSAALAFKTHDGKDETVRFSTPDTSAMLREYTQSTTMQLRDPGPQFVRFQESADLPAVRSGSLAFDALFALAGKEMKQNSVAQIRDGNYNGGAAIACDCFETGEQWHYVWTRDLSYAADLGLAMLDPQRVRNSLDFKLSPYRDGITRARHAAGSAGGLQIIQDTGSGGSWPVSTDRVAWAFGAEEALNNLPAAERKRFAARALKALVNTIENDRLAAFEHDSGLYMGEQSFLDWRDQSYAAWITGDLASMASSKALSTNVAHYKALTLAASLAAKQGKRTLSAKYGKWARALKAAINERLWLEDAGMYSSLTAAHFDGAPMHKFDWLGQSLAIITGVADPARAKRILASYPHGPLGAPVIWPQQPGMPIYHNRAIWPFVTAYGLKAAAHGGNASVADAAYSTLMRGAALNLSNMENLEWLSGQALLLDEKNPALSGPVINSRRQLWSVGAYLGMVIENVFGISATADGIAIRPFITARLRRDAFAQSNTISLERLQLRGRRIAVRIALPPASRQEGYYTVKSISVNGARATASIAWNQLPADSRIHIELGAVVAGQQQIRRVSADPYGEAENVFGPPEPDGGKTAQGIALNIYRNGKPAAAQQRDGACYALEAVYTSSGNRSHHSATACTGEAIDIPLAGAPMKDWGAPGAALDIGGIGVTRPGVYQVQIRYHNAANQINLGISGGVKWVTVRDGAGRIAAQGVVQMPHARSGKDGNVPVLSTPLAAPLRPGRYTLRIDDFYNMSYLQSNSTFSGAGGVTGPSNKVDLYGVRLLRIE